MKHNVMVVDDSRVNYAVMKQMLSDTDIEIVSYCRCGEEAVANYALVRPDLVVMDVILPGINGLEACQQLLRRWPEARVLMASSLAYDDVIEKAAEIGAKGFLFKPFDKRALTKTIHDAMTDGRNVED